MELSRAMFAAVAIGLNKIDQLYAAAINSEI